MDQEPVLLTHTAAGALLRAAAAALPAEMIAVLGGHRRCGGVAVDTVLPLPNAAANADRFALDAVAFARAEHALRAAGRIWLGFAHSHPAGPAAPSAADRREAWPDCLQLIVAPHATAGARIGAFRRRGAGLVELPIVRAAGDPR